MFPAYKPNEVYLEEFDTVIFLIAYERRAKEFGERQQEVAKYFNSTE